MPLPVPLRLAQELIVSVPVRQMAVKVGVLVRLPVLLVCAFSVCPGKKEGHKGGCPSKKDACPHKGWPVLRFGLMVGLGL